MLKWDRASLIMYLAILLIIAMLIWGLSGCQNQGTPTPDETIKQTSDIIRTSTQISIQGLMIYLNAKQPKLVTPIWADISTASQELDLILTYDTVNAEMATEVISHLGITINTKLKGIPSEYAQMAGGFITAIGVVVNQRIKSVMIPAEIKAYIQALNDGLKLGLASSKGFK